MARAFNLPVVWGTNGRLQGRSLSIARDANVPAIYVENGGGGTCDPARVEQNFQGCLNVARLHGMLDGPVSTSEVRYFVEDDRDQSGHLQVQSQAPISGYFQPEIILGHVVQRGQTIGHILDPLGDNPITIPAYDTGTVLFLRMFPSVQPGDPLLALLPITAPGEVSFPK